MASRLRRVLPHLENQGVARVGQGVALRPGLPHLPHLCPTTPSPFRGRGWCKGGAVKVGLPGHVSPAGTPEPNEAERARRGSGGRVIFLVPLPLVTAQGSVAEIFLWC
jgi:hypothetical protein